MAFLFRRKKKETAEPKPTVWETSATNTGIPFQHPVTDPLGSYTGIPADPDDVPVQDVDDL